MKFARPASTLAILAIAGATALAACGKSGTSNPTSTSSGTVGNAQAPAGTYGSVPAPSGTPHAGTVTWAMSPGATPNWIFPVVPGANNSVYTAFSFQYEMFRPLYWLVNGISPKEWPELSLANLPKFSNGNKTLTITMKSNYVWSDGKPVTSQDVAFYLALVKAGIKESPANWAFYTPGIGIPDEIASMSTPSPSTLVMNLKKAYNTSWFTQDQLGAIQ